MKEESNFKVQFNAGDIPAANISPAADASAPARLVRFGWKRRIFKWEKK